MSEVKWKNELLKNGIPLEHEISNIMVNNGFQIDSDYHYTRIDQSGKIKDFSIDLIATKWYDPNGAYYIPIECKYSQKGFKWCFFQHPNKREYNPSNVIRYIDMLSFGRLEKKVFWSQNQPVHYKNCIIKDDKIDRNTIYEGLMQLKYSLPPFILNKLIGSAHFIPRKSLPIFFCPIIVTNAELYSIPSETTIKDIENSKKVQEIATKKDYLIYKISSSPDFQRHISYYKLDFQQILKIDHFKMLEKVIQNEKYPIGLTTELDMIIQGESFWDYYSSYIICNKKYLKKLVGRIHNRILKSMETFQPYESWGNYFGKKRDQDSII